MVWPSSISQRTHSMWKLLACSTYFTCSLCAWCFAGPQFDPLSSQLELFVGPGFNSWAPVSGLWYPLPMSHLKQNPINNPWCQITSLPLPGLTWQFLPDNACTFIHCSKLIHEDKATVFQATAKVHKIAVKLQPIEVKCGIAMEALSKWHD